jgi:Zn-dependent protease
LILYNLDLIGQDLTLFLVLVGSAAFAAVVGFAFHEFCHAITADALGDPTPRNAGRITANPFAHLSPLGMGLFMLIGIGWAQTPVNPGLTRINPKTASLLISAAGPVSNVVAAGLIALPIQAGVVPFINPFDGPNLLDFRVSTTEDYIGLFLTGAVILNCFLAVFNMIPIFPLDGFRVAVSLLPDSIAEPLMRIAPQGPGILLLLIFVVPALTGYNPLSNILWPSVRWLVHLFTGV